MIACWVSAITCFSHFKLFEIQTSRSFYWTVSAKTILLFSVVMVYSNFGLSLPMCIVLHLLVLNVRHHLLLHSLKLSKSACKISQSDLFFNILNVLVSSANIFTLLYII